MVVSNPPYVATAMPLPPEVVDWEPTSALLSGEDGLDDLRQIVEDAPGWLEPQGVLVCELSPEQATTVQALASERFAESEVVRDLTGRQRALVARRPL